MASTTQTPDRSNEGFRYPPLDASKREIRLLKLDMSGPVNDIHCELQVASLDEQPEYEALSYTWGGFALEKLEISISNRSFLVTRNLFYALRNLKQPFTAVPTLTRWALEINSERYLVLWIDAICINQEDVLERNSQVQLMWSIYENASKVRVWLGEESDDDELGMEMVRLLNLHTELKYTKLLREILEENKEAQDRQDSEELHDMRQSSPRNSQVDKVENDEEPRQTQEAIQLDTVNEEAQNAEGVDEEATEEGGKTMNMFWMFNSFHLGRAPIQWSGMSLEGAPEASTGAVDISSEPNKSSEPRPLTAEEQSKLPFQMLFGVNNMLSGETPEPSDPKEWVHFQKLMERPWWRRMWVVQEVAAAKGPIWVGCGQSWMPWASFVGASLTIADMMNHPFMQRVNHLGGGAVLISEKQKWASRTDGRLDCWGGLLNLIFSTWPCHATDPRDKIFALLGFVPSIGLVPDYGMKVEDVYELLVKQSINSTRNLMFLALNRRPKRLVLPSWVPDFSLDLPEDEYNGSCPMGLFGADGNNWHNIGAPTPGCSLKPNDVPGQLTVYGFKFDNPLTLGQVWDGTSSERQSNFIRILPEYKAIMDEMDSEHFSNLVGPQRDEAWWRTLIWNADADDQYPAPDTFGEYVSRILKEESRLIVNVSDHNMENHPRVIPTGGPEMYYDAAVRHAFKRRLFITSKGHLGSGPAEMQMGDLICILLGFKTPVILREGSAESSYEFIGHAYVHGIMHGEGLGLLSRGKLHKRPRVAIREFCLI
jgi:hypothetical protein